VNRETLAFANAGISRGTSDVGERKGKGCMGGRRKQVRRARGMTGSIKGIGSSSGCGEGKPPATKGKVSRADKGSAACTVQTKAVCMPQHGCYQGRGEGFPIVCCKRRQPLHPFIPGVFVLRLRHASEVRSCSDRVTSNAANAREVVMMKP